MTAVPWRARALLVIAVGLAELARLAGHHPETPRPATTKTRVSMRGGPALDAAGEAEYRQEQTT